jgi:hypothetical protein
MLHLEIFAFQVTPHYGRIFIYLFIQFAYSLLIFPLNFLTVILAEFSFLPTFLSARYSLPSWPLVTQTLKMST